MIQRLMIVEDDTVTSNVTNVDQAILKLTNSRSNGEIISVDEMYFSAVHYLLPKFNELNHNQSGRILVVGENTYAVMKCGNETNVFHLSNDLRYLGERAGFLRETKVNQCALGFIPCSAAVVQELVTLGLEVFLTIQAKVPPVSAVVPIQVYCRLPLS